jgi:hypothetical protein
LNPTLLSALLHPSNATPCIRVQSILLKSAGMAQEKKKKKENTRAYKEHGNQPRPTEFNNLGFEKLYKYIYYEDVSACYYY